MNARPRLFASRELAPLTLETRADANGKEQRYAVGYAAVYYDGTEATQYRMFDDLVERVMPGAFETSIGRDDVAGLFNHDPSAVLGRKSAGTLTLTTDALGLRYEILLGETTVARDTAIMLERGDVWGSSFSFTVDGQRWVEGPALTVRELTQVTLYDVGPVTFPAYKGTSSGLRSESDCEEIRQLRRDVEAEAVAVRMRMLSLGWPRS
jgi:uncharacterized protein